VKRIWANLFILQTMRQLQQQPGRSAKPNLDRATKPNLDRSAKPNLDRATKPNLDVARRLAAFNRFLTPFTTLVAINDDLSRSRFGYHEVVSQLMPVIPSHQQQLSWER
jgi:hypothetical protein